MAVTARDPRESGRAGGSRSGRPALLAVLLCLASVAVSAAVGYVALHTSRGQDLDTRAMTIFSVNGEPNAARPVEEVLRYASVGTAGLVLLVFMAMALLRHGFATAVGAAGLVAGANLTTQLLKDVVLTRPDLGHGTLNSLPSGHTTLVFSLVLAAVLSAPSALRLLVAAAGAAVGTLTGATTVVAGWHRPSDVVVAMLVTLAWGAAVVAVLTLVSASVPVGRGRFFEAGAVLGSVLAVVLLLAWDVAPGPGPGELRAAVLAIGSVGLTSSFSVGLFARLAQRTQV